MKILINTIQIKNEKYWLIADMRSNKKVRVLFVRGRKINICFNCTILFCCTKSIRLNSTHYLLWNIPNKPEL